MGLRETINQNPVVTSAVVGAITLVALYMVGRNACGGGPATLPAGTAKAFYTVDEGKTRFVDDANKIPPFDKDGKMAYRAVVFKCADGKEFVNHLERYPEARRADIEKAGGPNASMLGMMAREIKRPGEKAWVTMQEPAKFAKVTATKCKDGSAATLVEAQ